MWCGSKNSLRATWDEKQFETITNGETFLQEVNTFCTDFASSLETADECLLSVAPTLNVNTPRVHKVSHYANSFGQHQGIKHKETANINSRSKGITEKDEKLSQQFALISLHDEDKDDVLSEASSPLSPFLLFTPPPSLANIGLTTDDVFSIPFTPITYRPVSPPEFFSVSSSSSSSSLSLSLDSLSPLLPNTAEETCAVIAEPGVLTSISNVVDVECITSPRITQQQKDSPVPCCEQRAGVLNFFDDDFYDDDDDDDNDAKSKGENEEIDFKMVGEENDGHDDMLQFEPIAAEIARFCPSTLPLVDAKSDAANRQQQPLYLGKTDYREKETVEREECFPQHVNDEIANSPHEICLKDKNVCLNTFEQNNSQDAVHPIKAAKTTDVENQNVIGNSALAATITTLQNVNVALNETLNNETNGDCSNELFVDDTDVGLNLLDIASLLDGSSTSNITTEQNLSSAKCSAISKSRRAYAKTDRNRCTSRAQSTVKTRSKRPGKKRVEENEGKRKCAAAEALVLLGSGRGESTSDSSSRQLNFESRRDYQVNVPASIFDTRGSREIIAAGDNSSQPSKRKTSSSSKAPLQNASSSTSLERGVKRLHLNDKNHSGQNNTSHDKARLQNAKVGKKQQQQQHEMDPQIIGPFIDVASTCGAQAPAVRAISQLCDMQCTSDSAANDDGAQLRKAVDFVNPDVVNTEKMLRRATPHEETVLKRDMFFKKIDSLVTKNHELLRKSSLPRKRVRRARAHISASKPTNCDFSAKSSFETKVVSTSKDRAPAANWRDPSHDELNLRTLQPNVSLQSLDYEQYQRSTHSFLGIGGCKRPNVVVEYVPQTTTLCAVVGNSSETLANKVKQRTTATENFEAQTLQCTVTAVKEHGSGKFFKPKSSWINHDNHDKSPASSIVTSFSINTASTHKKMYGNHSNAVRINKDKTISKITRDSSNLFAHVSANSEPQKQQQQQQQQQQQIFQEEEQRVIEKLIKRHVLPRAWKLRKKRKNWYKRPQMVYVPRKEIVSLMTDELRCAGKFYSKSSTHFLDEFCARHDIFHNASCFPSLAKSLDIGDIITVTKCRFKENKTSQRQAKSIS